MESTVSIIGGADGPTTIYLIEKLGLSWINLFGLVFVILLLIPNIIYAIKVKNQENKCQNRFINVLEQIGRYGCMFLMVFNIGILEFGYSSVETFLVYLIGNAVLLLSYCIVWAMYFHKQTYARQILLAVLPICLFLLSGITLLHYLLIVFAVIFGIAHVYVTRCNKVG